ncbi:MAG: hypothetical protein WBK51_08970 [Polaromonas sp.]
MRVHIQMKHLSIKVWLRIFLYAIFTGLLIQLVVLPYFFSQLHAGNGLLAGRDWVGFHEQAAVHAQQIALNGWETFRLRPDGDNAIIGMTSFFYVIFGPHPWTLLPLSAAMFATGGLALFSMLKRLNLDDSEAGIALLPYLFFPSALLQYGQIHKDVFCTAGVLVILWAWVGLLRKERKLSEVFPLLLISAFALILVSVFRPYFMFPFLGLALGLLAWNVLRIGWQLTRLQARLSGPRPYPELKFSFQSAVILAFVSGLVYVLSITYLDVNMRSVGSDDSEYRLVFPVFVLKSNETVRSADTVRLYSAGSAGSAGSAEARDASLKMANLEAAAIKAVQECRPIVILRDDAFVENTINRIFLKIAVARAGFTSSGGATAASNIDKGINFCKNEDLIHYIPRAMQIALFAPFPSKWFSTEKRNSSAVEIYISAVEMFYSYVAYIGLLYWLVSYRRWRIELLLPVAFALGLTLLLGLTVANVGTLYRMRFPFAMIFISLGMVGLMQMAKIRPRWLERLDSTADR